MELYRTAGHRLLNTFIFYQTFPQLPFSSMTLMAELNNKIRLKPIELLLYSQQDTARMAERINTTVFFALNIAYLMRR